MAVGASVLAATKKFGTSFLSQQLLDPRGSIRRRRSPWTHSTTPRLSSSPGTILSSFVSLVPGGGSYKALQSFFLLCFQARICLQIVLLACLEGVVVFASWLILVWSLAKLAMFRV
jgi:hypothetical protein